VSISSINSLTATGNTPVHTHTDPRCAWHYTETRVMIHSRAQESLFWRESLTRSVGDDPDRVMAELRSTPPSTRTHCWHWLKLRVCVCSTSAQRV